MIEPILVRAALAARLATLFFLAGTTAQLTTCVATAEGVSASPGAVAARSATRARGGAPPRGVAPSHGVAPPRVARPVPPTQLGFAEADSIRKAIEKDRSDTEKWLQSDSTSYLATVQRRDFGDRTTLTVGREPGNDVRIDDPSIAPHHLRVTVVGDSFHVEAVDEATASTTQGH